MQPVLSMFRECNGSVVNVFRECFGRVFAWGFSIVPEFVV